MTAPVRKYYLGILVCSIALIAGCSASGGGSSTGGPLSISTSTLPNGNVGTSYSSTIAATGGTSPYTWSLTSGTLQAGLALNSGTGTINGTPTASGTVSVTVQVADATTPTANTATVRLSLTVQTLNITTTSPLPAGSLGVPYSTTLVATGGTSPYTWSLSSGTLPGGLSLCTSTGATCAISGNNPTGSGLSTFAIEVTDSESPAVTFTKTFTISISPLSVLNTSLPNGLQGNPYSLTLDGVGGVSPYTWSVSGALPGGLSLNTTTGAISGTPTGFGTSNSINIHVFDSETPPEVATKSFAITITPAAGSCAGTPIGNEALLNGNYAFLVQGFEGGGAGTPVVIGASFAANAAGVVTGGDIDVSDAIGSTHYTIAAGSPLSVYTVGLDPTHAGNLGCVMLTTSAGTTMSFRFALGGVSGGIASKGRIIEFDDTSGPGTIASGIMSLQTTSSFAASHLSPSYAFGLDGQTLSGSPLAEAGSFSVSSTGTISSAFADVDTAGTNSGALSGGSGSITGISTTDGRGTASFSMSNNNFAWTIYIVNANEVYLVSSAFPGGGRALASAGPFSLSGNYIVYSSGIAASTCSGFPCADVNLGLLNLSGGAASGPLWDYNITAGESMATVSGGTYAVASPSGRVAFTGVGSNGLISYVVSPAVDGISGITVGADAGAHFGYISAQTTAAAPSGQFIYGTVDPRYNSVTTYAGTATITPGGVFTGTEDDSAQNGSLQQSVPVARTVNLLGPPAGTGGASRSGGSSIAATDGTRIFWFDFGNGAPPVVTIAEPQ